MRAIKKNTNLYKYLEERGLLNASVEVKREAIRDYKRLYDKALKQKKRAQEKRNFTISFSNNLMPKIHKQAKDYQADVTGYIKLLVKADLENNHPLHQSMLYKEILQTLQYFKNEIADGKGKGISHWMKDADYELLDKKIFEMEETIYNLIHYVA